VLHSTDVDSSSADVVDEMMIRFPFVIVRLSNAFQLYSYTQTLPSSLVLSFFVSGHLLYVLITCISILSELDDPSGSVGSATSLNYDSPRLHTARRPWRTCNPPFSIDTPFDDVAGAA
jgi:hypothetical protein